MDVAADPPDVGSHKVGFGWLLAQFLYHWLHGCQDALLLVCCIQVWDVPRVQNAVDILQKRLTLNL